MLGEWVDFEYEVDGKVYQYSMPGGEKITLSDLIEVLGIIGDTNNGEKAAFNSVDSFLKEVADVEFSDESLVKVTKNEEADDWTLESLEPFTSEETLTITMKNGDVVTVKVTDDQESSNLSDFLTKVTVSGASLENGNYVVEQGKKYSVTMTFKETANLQFDNEATLTYHMPSGVTLPDSIEKDITIAVVSGGITYEVKAHALAGTDGTVTVKFDESDPNYSKLASATNVSFRVSVNAQFDENINKTQWGAKMDKDIILDTTDHSDAFAEKSGYFDESTGIFHYTVKVKANGNVTNVNVKDIISGNALIFNNDVQVSGNSSSFTNNELSAGQKGFDYTFPSMNDGEEIVITYSASLDQTVAKSSDIITADQTKNTVTVQKEGGEPHNAVYSQEINMKSPQKSDGTIAGVTEDGDKLYNWSIDYNPLALVSAAGDKIKDSIGASSQEYMKYYGNVTVKVYDHAGTQVDTRSFTPGSDSSWEYTIPTGDTTPYHYVFEYQTIVDETKVIEGGSSLELKNEVEGKGGKDSGKIDVEHTDETTIDKSAESFNQQEITWSAVVHVGEGGLNKAEVIDTLPNIQLQDYNWELGIDLFKKGSLTVEGLVDGENYTVDSTSDPKQVKIVFTKDGQPGLKGVPGGHDIKIKLTTKVDQRWLHEAELYGSYWQTHQNAISINGKSDTAEVEIGATGVEKKVSKTTVTIDGEQKTAFEYNIVLKNVYDDSIVVSDTFDKNLLYLLEDPNHNKNSTNDINLHIYGGDQYNQNDPREGALINYSESENGIIFRSDSLPKDANGNPYSYYRICYFLVLKDGVDLESLAVENGGKYSIINNAKWGDHEGTATYEHKYDFLNKELVQEATSTVRHVKYKITYNLAKGELNGGEDIQMTDRLNENLSIDYTSIQIETDPAGVNVPYSLSGDGAETVATYTIPDSTAVTITYDAMVVGNGSVNYKNTVKANGEIKTVDKTTSINIEGEGSGAVADLKITKVDGYDANKKLAGVKFKLYAADGRSLSLDENEDLKEVILETDENGVLHIDGNKYKIFLGTDPSVKYYLEEVAPPDGYRTISFPYQFTLVDDINDVDYEHFTYFFNDSFQIKNWPLEGLVVGKNVESDEEADHTKEFTFEVSILAEDGEVDTSVNQKYGDMTFTGGVATFTLKDKEQASAWSMPAGTRFKVEEKDADGFTVSATSGETTTEGAVFTGETSGEYTLVTFNNTRTPQTGSLKITKNVTVDGESTTGTLADGTYTFEIWNSDATSQITTNAEETAIGTLSIVVENGKPKNSITVEKLPVGTYVVKERGSTNTATVIDTSVYGYNANLGGIVVTVVAGDVAAAPTAAFKNKYETTEATVKKVWAGSSDVPQSLEVTLLKNGEATSEKVTLRAPGWEGTIQNLPKYENGVEIDYQWSEEDLPDGYFLTNYSENGTITTLTNTSSHYDLKTSYTGVKTWEDQDNKYKTRPSGLVVTLYADDVAKTNVPEWNYDYATNQWAYTFKDLPVFNEQGEFIKYRTEETVPAGYQKSSQTNTPTSGTIGTITYQSGTGRNTPDNRLTWQLGSLVDLSFVAIKPTSNGPVVVWTHRIPTPTEEDAIKTELAKPKEALPGCGNRLIVWYSGVSSTMSTPHGDVHITYDAINLKVTLKFDSPGEWSQFIWGQFNKDGSSKYEVGTTSFTNTLDTTSLSGKKTWVINGTTGPADPILTLTRTVTTTTGEGEDAVTTTSAPETVTVKQGDTEVNLQPTWSGTGKERTFKYTGLPAKDKDGNTYTYSVAEYQFTVDDVTYTVTKDADGAYVATPDTEHTETAAHFQVNQTGNAITNTKVTDFEFSKIWKDISSNPVEWPTGATITVTLNAYTNSSTQEAVLEDQTLTFSPTSLPNGWTVVTSTDGKKTTYKVNDLPAVTSAGDTLTYYVVETQVTGYKEPSYADKDGHRLINVGKATNGQQIINVPEDGVELPSTGGPGTRLFTILGSILILGAGVLLWRRWRLI